MQDSGAEREVDKHKSSFLKLFAEICKSLYITVSQCIDCGLLKMAHCRLKKKKQCMTLQCPFSGHGEGQKKKKKNQSRSDVLSKASSWCRILFIAPRERESCTSDLWACSTLDSGSISDCVRQEFLEAEKINFFYTACSAASSCFCVLPAALCMPALFALKSCCTMHACLKLHWR